MQNKDWTFRVRGIPVDWGRERLASVLAEQDEAAGPSVRSLARETHGRWSSATVSFQCIPAPLQALGTAKTWDIAINDESQLQPEFLSLDDEFIGMTTLYSPPETDHKLDIIAISGLGGHAFGSFKDKASNHMWLRDTLPFHLTNTITETPMARVMTYGYNSKVVDSHATQNLEDIATAFLTTLRPLAGDTGRRIILIAHSLGGLVVKQVCISRLTNPSAALRMHRCWPF
jgi:hypothetical protein